MTRAERYLSDVISDIQRNILEKQFEKTEELLKKHMPVLSAVAEELLEKETISGEEFNRCFVDTEEGGNEDERN